ncbi:hypothetical protein ACHQM5_019118 [Ranunculus cassubicifolius]
MEDTEEDLHLLHFPDLSLELIQNPSRQICSNGCSRPTNVCLCNLLPSQPLPTSTQILILHHPHERRHKLATVPMLTKCLTKCQVVIGRRLHASSSPLLEPLYTASMNDPSKPRQALFLFPGTNSLPSVELNQWVLLNRDKVDMDKLVLIVFDGTWKHAKEMVESSLKFLNKFASPVCLSYDVGVEGESIYNSELVLRKEPFSGCMSTIEAVARALRVLEPNGVEVENVLIEALRGMVKFQASNLKPMKPRPKMLKKGKVAMLKSSESDE